MYTTQLIRFLWGAKAKEILQKESGRRLCYIYCIAVVHISMVVHPGTFPATSGASSVKIWHPPRTDREKGSEEGERERVDG
jgi:hypothetical protein